MRSSGLLALAGSASAVYQGFNYGATKSDGYTVRAQSDFESLFSTAKNLVGTSGFTSARLYTMIVSCQQPWGFSIFPVPPCSFPHPYSNLGHLALQREWF